MHKVELLAIYWVKCEKLESCIFCEENVLLRKVGADYLVTT